MLGGATLLCGFAWPRRPFVREARFDAAWGYIHLWNMLINMLQNTPVAIPSRCRRDTVRSHSQKSMIGPCHVAGTVWVHVVVSLGGYTQNGDEIGYLRHTNKTICVHSQRQPRWLYLTRCPLPCPTKTLPATRPSVAAPSHRTPSLQTPAYHRPSQAGAFGPVALQYLCWQLMHARMCACACVC